MLGGFLGGEERISLTDLGHLALQRGNEEEPSSEVLRLFTSVLLLRHPPAWVAYWQGDPSSLDLVLPDPSRQLLEDARVLNKIGVGPGGLGSLGRLESHTSRSDHGSAAQSDWRYRRGALVSS